MENKMGQFCKNKKITMGLWLLLSAAVFTGVSIYWAQYKTVDFCDEIYTYLLSNSTNPNRQFVENVWFNKEYTQQILTTQRGSGFYNTLFNVRFDVHPPLYFMVFHLMSMIFGGSASPWIGLSINFLCQMVTILVLFYLTYKISKKGWMAALGCIAFAVFPFMVSNTMLIRMYSMLSMWTALFMAAGYFLVMGKNTLKKHWYMYILLCLITIGGFLTQYYFSIFAVGFTIGYVIYLIYKKDPLKILWHLISMAAAVVISTVLWKYWLEHIFGGYRGTEAFANLTDIGSVLGSLWRGVMISLDFLFGNILQYGVLLAVIGMLVVLFVKKKADRELAFILISMMAAEFTSLLILLVTSEGLFADRYFFASGQALWIGICCLTGYFIKHIDKKAISGGVAAVFLGICVFSCTRTNLITQMDLSGTEKENYGVLEQYGNIPWIYYGGENWKMTGNLMDYLIPEEYIVLSSENDYSENEKLQAGEEFILYVVDDYYDPKGAFEEMEKALGCSLETEYLFDRGYSKVFHVYMTRE